MDGDRRLDGQPSSWPEKFLDRVAALDFCDGYLVLVGDPATGEVDAHGPYTGLDATFAAATCVRTLTLAGSMTSRSVSSASITERDRRSQGPKCLPRDHESAVASNTSNSRWALASSRRPVAYKATHPH
jgi:hypothetical protein